MDLHDRSQWHDEVGPPDQRDDLSDPRDPVSDPLRLARHPTRQSRYRSWHLLLLGDLAAVALSAVLVPQFGKQQLLFLTITLTAWRATGLYGQRLSLSVLNDAPRLLAGIGVGAGVATMLAVSLLHGRADFRLIERATAVGMAALLLRSFTYAAIRTTRRRRRGGPPTIILGAGTVGVRLARIIVDHPEYGLRFVGFVDSKPLAASHLPAPLLGGKEELSRVITKSGAEVVIVAFGGIPEHDLVVTLRTCDRLNCEMFIVPRLFELHDVVSHQVDELWGIPLAHLRRAPYRTASWRVKRFFDVSLAGLALCLLWPVMLAVWVAVRCELGREVLFTQERVGLDGRRFALLKFRSLHPASEDESSTSWTVRGDPRIGPVGKIIRATSLDELPQLLNILRGDMSFVGPRPERPHFVEQFSVRYPRYVDRHRVPAGLTGLAAVQGLRGDTSIEERQMFDNIYIESWSLWLDVKILLRTVAAVCRRTGG